MTATDVVLLYHFPTLCCFLSICKPKHKWWDECSERMFDLPLSPYLLFCFDLQNEEKQQMVG